MNTLTANELDSLNNFALSVDGAIRTSYSGRGMYGASCIGIDLNGSLDMLSFGIELAEILGKDRAKDMIQSVRIDSMGKGIFIYFPDWHAPEDYKIP